MQLTDVERHILAGGHGEAAAIALRIVSETGRLLGADRLIPVASAHVDGCLYLGDTGTRFAEKLVQGGAQVAVPTTLNVGALDLLNPANIRLNDHTRAMVRRHMQAYEAMGCRATWTCAPYQAGHRPKLGEDVAWGESNAVVFCNSVLGARTNRYGDLLDIACAIIGRAPLYGLHRPENREARIVVDVSQLSSRLRSSEAFWPVLGAWLGRTVGEEVAVIEGLQGFANEDRLKALGAAAASYGAVALFHIAGVTPEAPTVDAVLSKDGARATFQVTAEMMASTRDILSTAQSDAIDYVAVGSPHLSYEEAVTIAERLAGRTVRLPFYANTGRHVVQRLEREGRLKPLVDAGIRFIVDTCIVVTPIVPSSGILMTNSGKFACYVPGTTGCDVMFGSTAECVESAVAGRLVRDMDLWT